MAKEEAGGAGKGSTESGKAGGETITGAGDGKSGGAAGAGEGDKGKGAGDGKGAEGDKGGKAGDEGGDGKGKEGKTGDEGKTGKEGKDGKDGKEGAGDGKPKTAADFKLTIPEGSSDYLDDGDVKAISKIAAAEGWTNEQAQEKLEQHADAIAAQSKAFRVETEADETYGGDNLAETQRLARLALDKVRPADTPAGKAIRRLLARSGYGNNLAVVSLLADLGKLMDEDGSAGQGGGGGGQRKGAGGEKRAPEAVLYDKS